MSAKELSELDDLRAGSPSPECRTTTRMRTTAADFMVDSMLKNMFLPLSGTRVNVIIPIIKLVKPKIDKI
jgi:hypothetical protein